jgi:hypothetical protein
MTQLHFCSFNRVRAIRLHRVFVNGVKEKLFHVGDLCVDAMGFSVLASAFTVFCQAMPERLSIPLALFKD